MRFLLVIGLSANVLVAMGADASMEMPVDVFVDVDEANYAMR